MSPSYLLAVKVLLFVCFANLLALLKSVFFLLKVTYEICHCQLYSKRILDTRSFPFALPLQPVLSDRLNICDSATSTLSGDFLTTTDGMSSHPELCFEGISLSIF